MADNSAFTSTMAENDGFASPNGWFFRFCTFPLCKTAFFNHFEIARPIDSNKNPGRPILLDGGNTLLRRQKPLTRSRSSGRKPPTTSADWPLSIDGAERARPDPAPLSRMRADAAARQPGIRSAPDAANDDCARFRAPKDVCGKLHPPPCNERRLWQKTL